tara:strand:+ start:33 stop:353 length:321 start_codon:yes stop_codon:yes gene_type:complete
VWLIFFQKRLNYSSVETFSSVVFSSLLSFSRAFFLQQFFAFDLEQELFLLYLFEFLLKLKDPFLLLEQEVLLFDLQHDLVAVLSQDFCSTFVESDDLLHDPQHAVA